MFLDVDLVKRHHLRKDKIREVEESLKEFGAELEGTIELAEANGVKVVLSDGEPVAFSHQDKIVPTVKGALKWLPDKKFVTVDKGAISFICSGADVMAPGVVEADRSIKNGDIVIIYEETHEKPIAVGKAEKNGERIINSKKGCVVENFHYVGDDLWNLLE